MCNRCANVVFILLIIAAGSREARADSAPRGVELRFGGGVGLTTWRIDSQGPQWKGGPSVSPSLEVGWRARTWSAGLAISGDIHVDLPDDDSSSFTSIAAYGRWFPVAGLYVDGRLGGGEASGQTKDDCKEDEGFLDLDLDFGMPSESTCVPSSGRNRSVNLAVVSASAGYQWTWTHFLLAVEVENRVAISESGPHYSLDPRVILGAQF